MLVGEMFLPLEVMIEVLLAAGDAQVAVLELAEVAGAHEVAHEGLGRRLVVAVVALEHVRAAEQDLAVLGDLDREAGQRRADGAEARVVRRVEGGRGARLAHPVALEHGDPAGVEELEHLERDRRRAGQGQLEPAAEHLAHLAQHEPVGERVLRLQSRRGGAAPHRGARLAAGGDRPREQALLDRRCPRCRGPARGRGSSRTRAAPTGSASARRRRRPPPACASRRSRRRACSRPRARPSAPRARARGRAAGT